MKTATAEIPVTYQKKHGLLTYNEFYEAWLFYPKGTLSREAVDPDKCTVTGEAIVQQGTGEDYSIFAKNK